MSENRKKFIEEKLDFYVATLIGIATFLGALAAYYSSVWGGNSVAAYSNSTVTMAKANEQFTATSSEYNAALMQDLKNETMYIEFFKAARKGDIEDMKYFYDQMNEDYQKFVEDPNQPDKEYDTEAMDKAYNEYRENIEYTYDDGMDSVAVIHKKGRKQFKKGENASSNGDKFTFVTVLFTVALFFGGMTAVAKKDNIKLLYFAMFGLVLVYSCIRMFMIPFP